MTGEMDTTGMTVTDALGWAGACFGRAELAEPDREAGHLLAALLGCTKGELYLGRTQMMSEGDVRAYRRAVERRVSGEPSQYIAGEQEFRGLSFKVNRDVLIPRPETELLVEEALDILRNSGKRDVGGEYGDTPIVIDLCTGSGCIAVAMTHEMAQLRCVATDLSKPALRIARENAVRSGVQGRIEFLEGDLFDPLEGEALGGRVDMIVSNPPYVPKGEIATLQTEVRCFEPVAALDGGEDGLDFIRRIVSGAPHYLTGEGALVMEIGYGQSEGVQALFEESDYSWTVEVRRDYAGIERVVKARL
ncbi:MAG: peptide chain release factor N(5)-glutamine methyltransferase [Thermodesulfobacteriota bacterium]